MSSKFIILSALLAVAAASYVLPLLDTRIVGGSEATPGQYPWQVSLQWGVFNSLSHFCGGSIINSQWILTAGHCAEAVPNYGTFVVKAGKHDLKKVEGNEQSVKVVKSIVHESYPGGVAPYDIALLKLASPLKLNSAVKAINLPKANSEPSGNAILTGWGSISKTNSPVMPDKLQKAELPIVGLSDCKQAIEKLTGPSPLENTNVCTGPLTGGYSACNGDSGGPLILNNNGSPEVIGIVSWGIVPCGTKGAPSVYTKTSAFVDWIQKTIKLLVVLSVGFVLCVEENGMVSNLAMLAQRPTRIVGGKDAEKGLHPWQVSIHWGHPERKIRPRHVCGGSLLTAGWILTAGHCKTLPPPNGEFTIFAGKYTLGIVEDTEQKRLVTKSFVHPRYDGSIGPYDIALMQVEEPFELNPFVSTVSLPYLNSIPTGEAMLTGWGSIGRTREPEIPENLQAAILPIIDYDLCKTTLDKTLKPKEKNPLHSTNICTGPLDGSLSACKGDSGGPLVLRNQFEEAEIVGIVSWGIFPCGGKNAPSVYTRVSAFLTWVKIIVLNYS
ncbi:transmembrane protease serine 9-like [Ceratina calcarata]|uniref:chymotrypsin n=1 Tax=Ceratina calcarata TaxID=156304 RepID=A0AAJ7JEZ9_9HYME|nr:transmembrane protease serine 9-like [Ceratina calcarata]